MARDFNQQNPDGTWWHVSQDNNGNYSHTVISDPTAGGGYTPPTGTGSSPPPGQATQEQMVAALQHANYNGPWDPQSVSDAYARTYNGGNAGGAAGAAGAGGTDVNVAAANAAANAAYQNGILAHMSDQLAFDKATEAWTETFKQGQANNTNALSWLDLASKLTGPANAFQYAKLLTGTPGGLADIVRAAGGGYQMPAFGGGSGGASTPLSIDSIIADLNKYSPTGGGAAAPTASGPSGTYQTPNGTKTTAQMKAELDTAAGGKWSGDGGDPNDPANIAAGYQKTTGGTVTPNSVNAGGHPPITAPGNAAGVNPSSGTNLPAPTASANPAAGTNLPAPTADANQAAGVHIHIPMAVVNPASGTPKLGSAAPSNPTVTVPPAGQTIQQSPAPPVTSGYIPPYGPLPTSGNQLAPSFMNNADPSQMALLGGAYGNAGYNFNDILAQYQRSLKGYGGPGGGAVGF